MDSFRYVGTTPTEIEEGEEIRRPIEPGEFTGQIDVTGAFPHNKMLLDEGKLIQAAAPEQVKEPTSKASQGAGGEGSDTGKAGDGS